MVCVCACVRACVHGCVCLSMVCVCVRVCVWYYCFAGSDVVTVAFESICTHFKGWRIVIGEHKTETSRRGWGAGLCGIRTCYKEISKFTFTRCENAGSSMQACHLLLCAYKCVCVCVCAHVCMCMCM